MVTRAEVKAANQKLIDAAVKASRESQEKIKAARHETFRRLGITFVDDTKRKAEGVQAQTSGIGLSDATRRAQQELSEKFGIPTFDVTGLISTVPKTRAIDPSIDVGTGILTPEAFSDSLRALTKGTDVLQGFSNAANDLIIKPVVEAWETLFKRRDINDLPVEKQTRARAIETRLKYLESKRVVVPECETKRHVRFFRAGRHWWGSHQDCTKRNEANKKNEVYDAEIKILEEELESLFVNFGITKTFNEEITKKAAQLQSLLDTEPLTAQLKADIVVKLQESSKLIEKILAEQIGVSQSKLTELQKRMKALAFRLHDPIGTKQENAGNILKDVGDFFSGVGVQLGEVFEKFSKEFVEALETLTDFSVKAQRDRLVNQVLAYDSARKKLGTIKDFEALQIENSLKAIAGEQTRS